MIDPCLPQSNVTCTPCQRTLKSLLNAMNIRTLDTLIPHIEKLFFVKLRDGLELWEYENVEHTTARGRVCNAERFSDGRRGMRERMMPKQLRNMVSYGIVNLRDLLNLVQDIRLASATGLSPKNLGHHPILEVAIYLRECFASDRDHIGGPSL
jgi:hypothetical protein